MTRPSTAVRTRLSAALTLVLILLACSVFINYIDRGNLSIAAPLLKGELHISDSQLGLLLSGSDWSIFESLSGRRFSALLGSVRLRTDRRRNGC